MKRIIVLAVLLVAATAGLQISAQNAATGQVAAAAPSAAQQQPVRRAPDEHLEVPPPPFSDGIFPARDATRR